MEKKYKYKNNILPTETNSVDKWIDEGDGVVLYEVKNPWYRNIVQHESVNDNDDTMRREAHLLDKFKDEKDQVYNSGYKYYIILCMVLLIIIILLYIKMDKKKYIKY